MITGTSDLEEQLPRADPIRNEGISEMLCCWNRAAMFGAMPQTRNLKKGDEPCHTEKGQARQGEPRSQHLEKMGQHKGR